MGLRAAGSPPQVVVAIDFETYYDDQYSLSKQGKNALSTSEYVRDGRFEALSCAIKVGDSPTVVFFGAEIAPALKTAFKGRVAALAHHAHFDCLILSHHFGIVPAYYLDTLSMARGLHPKFERNDLGTIAERYGVSNKLPMPDFKGRRAKDIDGALKTAMRVYNARDVDAMVEIFEKMSPEMPSDEMDLIDMTVRMFAAPCMTLNTALAKRELKREAAERRAFIGASGALALAREAELEVKPKKKGEAVDDERVLSSNKIFPEILRHVGIEPPRKISKHTGKETYALSKADEDFTDLIAHPDARVVALVRGRLAAKSTIGETRAARLIRSGSDGKRLPVYLNYCRAHTLRWSGGDKLNYQNMKKKGKLRLALKAPKGERLVVVDSSTIEVRVLAWLAHETWLLDAFRNGFDPYCLFGEEIYGRKIVKGVDILERMVSKVCVLALGYQMGGPKLQVGILAESIRQELDPVRLEIEVCYGLVNKYRAKNKRIVDLWKFMHNDVIGDIVTLPQGESKEYRGVDYGRGFVRLQGHLGMHYPEAKARFVKSGGKSGWGRATPVEVKVDEASYRTPMGRSKLYGGLMTENWVQYLARIVVAEQMLAISRRYPVVMTTHDEVVYRATNREADRALEFGLQVMKTSPVWAPDLPVSAEGGHDSVYSK